MALLDPELEDEAHDAPGEVVQWCRWGNGAGAVEYQGCDDETSWGLRPALDDKVDDDGEYGTDEKEDEEARVDASRGEDPIRPNQAPDDGGYECQESVPYFGSQ